MEQGRVTETELMPRLLVDYTELGCGKLKKGNGFSAPNFEPGPSPLCQVAKRDQVSSG